MTHNSIVANNDSVRRLMRLPQGVTLGDAIDLRRISMTLHRWHELECGIDGGGIEREEAWTIRHATDVGQRRKRFWWVGDAWVLVKSNRRSYSDAEKTSPAFAMPEGGEWVATGSKPYWLNSLTMRRSLIPDREAGALRRLKLIMARYPTLSAYVQTDPRGASLYILRPGDVREGSSVESCYSNGIAVFK